MHQREITFTEDYRRIQEIHQAEIQKIEEARIIERRKLEENQRKLEQDLNEIQKKFDERERQFEDDKKTEVKKIVKESGDRPDELAKLLAKASGIQVIAVE